MTKDEAIEILNNKITGEKPIVVADLQEAIKLGIEALEAWAAGRNKHGWFYFPLLPGEKEG